MKQKQQSLALLADPESLYEEAPCGYFSFLPDGRIVKINKTLLKWLGYTSDAVLEKMKITNLLTKGGAVYYEMVFLAMMRLQERVNELNFDIVRADGSLFPALVNAVVVRDEAGDIVGVNAIVNDITERKRFENDLLKAKAQAETEKKKYEFLSDFTPELIWAANADGLINTANRRFLNYFGLPKKTLDLKLIIGRIHPEDRIKSLKAWMTSIRTGIKFHMQLRLSDKHGKYNWYMVRAEAFRDHESKIEHWIGSCSDIDIHILAAEKRDEFLNIAGHELKTPITSLKASLQLLDRVKHTLSSELPIRLIEQSNLNMDKIIRLINELLVAGKHNDGVMFLNKTHFNLSCMLSSCCMHVRLAGKHKLINIGNENVSVYADEQRIDQVVVNFVNNAVKYAGTSKEIILLTELTGEHVKVSVTDKGPGIPADKIPFLFDRYFRGGETENQSGLGLGLYICSDIVKRHGGDIGVESKVGEGTTFWFSLPLLKGRVD